MPDIVFKGYWMFINGKRFLSRDFRNKQDVLKAFKMWEKGVSVKIVSSIYKISVVTFKSMRKAAGYFVPHGGHHLRGKKLKETLENQKMVIQELKKGKTRKEIMEKTNLSFSFITYVRQSYNKGKEIFKAENVNVQF